MTIKNYIIIILKIIFVCLGSWKCEFDIKILNSLDFLCASLVNYLDCFLDCNKVVFYDMSLSSFPYLKFEVTIPSGLLV